MSSPFLGEIRSFPYNFTVFGWAQCDGQLLSISQYTALFSLLGTTYGGNGTTNFALPDLRSRVAVSFGEGPGLDDYALGEEAGSENVTILQTQMPAHTHGFQVSSAAATSTSPSDATFAVPNVDARLQDMYSSSSTDSTAAGTMIVNAGGSQPHSNIQPYLAINYQIALQGIYPSRS